MWIKLALSATDILADADSGSASRASECTPQLYRFDINTGTLDFVTRCARSANAWEQRIQLIDLNYILDEDEKLEEEPVEEGYEGSEVGVDTPKIVTFEQLIEAHPEVLESDILIHCNCPAYLYKGYKYLMTQLDTALEPEERYPDQKNPDLEGTVCKHLIAVLRRYFV